MKTVNEILTKYNNEEITIEEANAALKEAGANFHLEPEKATANWTDAEMKEGFMPGEAAEVLLDKPDMSRRQDLAGLTVRQKTKKGYYDVAYDELGYAVAAKLIQ